MPRDWTQRGGKMVVSTETEAEILRRIGNRESIDSIREEMGLTDRAITVITQKYGLHGKLKKMRQIQLVGKVLEQVIDLYINQGWGFKRISMSMHVMEGRVRQALIDAGITIRRVNKTGPDLMDAIADDYVNSGIDTRNLARKHGVTCKVIYRVVKERGLERLVQPTMVSAWDRCGRRSAYQMWIDQYGQEEADRRFTLTKAKMSKNNARYGKPALYGGGKSWSGWYKGTHFRSLRELTFMMHELEQPGVEWVSGEAKEYMMEYTGFDGRPKTYRPDYIIPSAKLMIEIKPINLWYTPAVTIKRRVAEARCKEIGWTYILIDPPVDIEGMLQAYRDGHIKWMAKTQIRFDDRHGKDLTQAP